MFEPFDLLRFRQMVNGIFEPQWGVLEDYIDADRNGLIEPFDLLRFRQLINGIFPATQPWASQTMKNSQP